MMDLFLIDTDTPRRRVRLAAALGAMAVAAVPVFIAAGLGNAWGGNLTGRVVLTPLALLAVALSSGWIGWRLIDPNGRHAWYKALPLSAGIWLLSYYLLFLLLELFSALENPASLAQGNPLGMLWAMLVSNPALFMMYALVFTGWYTLPVALIAGYMLSRRYCGRGASARRAESASVGSRRLPALLRLDADAPRRRVRLVAAAWVAAVAVVIIILATIDADEGAALAADQWFSGGAAFPLVGIIAAAISGYWIGWRLIDPTKQHVWYSALLTAAAVWLLACCLFVIPSAVYVGISQRESVIPQLTPYTWYWFQTVFFNLPVAGLRFLVSFIGWYSLPVALIAGYLLSHHYRSHERVLS